MTKIWSWLVLSVAFAGVAARAQFPHPNGGGLERGTLPLSWATGGPKCMEMPQWQVHEYNPNLLILRQSGCTDYEKPFVYLFFGSERALLLDTGSRKGNIAPELLRTVHLWMERNHRTSMPVLVVHTHSHEDHTAGDAEISAIRDAAVPITLVVATVDATKQLYGIKNWPEDLGSVSLGGRTLDVIPIPGHDGVSVAFYDRNTGILQTGDSLYPGRIYIRDFDAFARSNARLMKFAAKHPVAYILGNHIEQTRTPFLDYPVGTIYQPDEHPLQLYRGALLEMQAAIDALGGKPARVAYAEFSLWPSGPQFRAQPGEREAYEQRQSYQNEHKWDQTPAQPGPSSKP